MEITKTEFAQAEANMATKRQAGHAITARYDAGTACVIVRLHNDVQISFHADLIEGLAHASPDDLADIEITPAGLGLHWPRLDADVYVPALLNGILGSKRWMASQLGSAGGKARTEAKAAASRENGLKGGRPRRVTA